MVAYILKSRLKHEGIAKSSILVDVSNESLFHHYFNRFEQFRAYRVHTHSFDSVINIWYVRFCATLLLRSLLYQT